MTKFVALLFIATASFSLNVQHYFTSFDGVKIAYSDEGKGGAVFLIHGFINTGASWNKTQLKKDLLQAGYRVIAPDLRGNGNSDKPKATKAYVKNAEVKDLMALKERLKINTCMVIGYSRGSIVLAKWLSKDKSISRAVY